MAEVRTWLLEAPSSCNRFKYQCLHHIWFPLLLFKSLILLNSMHFHSKKLVYLYIYHLMVTWINTYLLMSEALKGCLGFTEDVCCGAGIFLFLSQLRANDLERCRRDVCLCHVSFAFNRLRKWNKEAKMLWRKKNLSNQAKRPREIQNYSVIFSKQIKL